MTGDRNMTASIESLAGHKIKPRGERPEPTPAVPAAEVKVYSKATANLLKPLKLKSTDRLHLSMSNDKKFFLAKVVSAKKYNFPPESWWERQALPDATITMRPEAFTTDNITPSGDALSVFFDRVPEKKRLDAGDYSWQLAATDYTAMVMKALWPLEQVIFDCFESKLAYVTLLGLVKRQEEVAQVYADYKATGKVPEHDLEIHWDNPLSPYQAVAAHLADKSEGFGLFMDPGTGKTATAISQICTLARRRKFLTGKAAKIMVVVPKNVQSNWAREFGKFTTKCGSVTVLKGGLYKRMGLLAEAAHAITDPEVDFVAVITSYETMIKTWPLLSSWQWDLAVADEAHMFKWWKTARYEHMLKLRDIAAQRVVLTGTPVANSPLDLYCLFEFMGEGWSGFTSWDSWREFYGVFVRDEDSGHDKFVACQNLPFMQERLARLSFRITKKEAMPDLPEQLYDTEDVAITGVQFDVYKQVLNQLAAEIEDDLSGDVKTLTIQNILTKLLRLSQITSGYVKWDPIVDPNTGEEIEEGKVEYFAENPKLDAIIAKLKAREPGSKTIIWSNWVPCIKQCSERLEKEGIKHVTYYGSTKNRDEAERLFNCDPETTVLVGNPAAGGVGLNLLGFDPNNPDEYTTNCDSSYYISRDWSSIKAEQSANRNHRRGTRVAVQITDFIVPNSIDTVILDRVNQKIQMMKGVNDIRDILNAVLNGIQELMETE